jgi:putative phosphoesterase
VESEVLRLVRLGIISDVHCAAEELQLAAELLIAEGAQEILLAGDAHFEYRFSNEVASLIQAYKMRYILGNHEAVLLGPHGQRALSRPHVGAANLRFTQETPFQLRTNVGGKTLTMVHANPWTPDNRYLGPHDRLFDRCDELDTDFLVLGHTHVPAVFRRGRTLVVNPGSLAMTREPGAPLGTVTYAVLDTDSDAAEIVRTTREGLRTAVPVELA